MSHLTNWAICRIAWRDAGVRSLWPPRQSGDVFGIGDPASRRMSPARPATADSKQMPIMKSSNSSQYEPKIMTLAKTPSGIARP